MRLIGADKLTAQERAKLATAARRARPTAAARAEFAVLRAEVPSGDSDI
jgi:hypothetical protein